MDFVLYLLMVLVLILISNVCLTIVGFKVKSVESMILTQTLPLVCTFAIMSVFSELFDIFYPAQDSDGLAFGIFVVLPAMVMFVSATTTLGILGIVRCKASNKSPYLGAISIFSTLNALTFFAGYFVYPIIFILILLIKAKRWFKKRREMPITK